MTPKPISYYARELRAQLPADVFETVPSRLAWLALHVAVATVIVFRAAPEPTRAMRPSLPDVERSQNEHENGQPRLVTSVATGDLR